MKSSNSLTRGFVRNLVRKENRASSRADALASGGGAAVLTDVIPQTGGGALTALRINEIRDGGSYTIPLANSISVNQTIQIDLPDEYGAFTPVVSVTGADTISYSGGTDTSITFDTGLSERITLTSDGVSNWGL